MEGMMTWAGRVAAPAFELVRVTETGWSVIGNRLTEPTAAKGPSASLILVRSSEKVSAGVLLFRTVRSVEEPACPAAEALMV